MAVVSRVFEDVCFLHKYSSTRKFIKGAWRFSDAFLWK